jgi:hypothetical protein
MDKYLTEILGDDGSSVDSQAMADIHALTQGQTPPVPEAPSKEYLATFEKFMQSEGFKSITDVTIKQNIVAFAQAVMDKAKAGIGEPGTVQSEQNPAAPAPAEQAGVVPGETPAAPAAPEGQPVTQPAPTAAPVDNTGQNFLQRIISRVRGK